MEKEGVQEQQNKCVNLDYLKQRTKNNPTVMLEMISLYLEQTPYLLNSMKQSLRDNDWNSLRASSHKMIPSFSIMGISTEFENMARKIQEFASIPLQTDGIPNLVLQLENICTRACTELEEEFKLIKIANSA